MRKTTDNADGTDDREFGIFSIRAILLIRAIRGFLPSGSGETADSTDETDSTDEAGKNSSLSAALRLSAVKEMLHDDITEKVIGAAMAVLNELRPGLDEKLYENALVLELIARGHFVEQQREYPVHYRGHLIGKLIPDLIVDKAVIVDAKVVAACCDSHVAQMLGYLNITGLKVALLLNFKESRLAWRRVTTEKRPNIAESARIPDPPLLHP